MSRAAEETHQLSANRDQDVEGPASMAVTFDGTWMRRGFSSLHGVFSCIAWDTGRIVDLEVCSKFCRACNMKKYKLEQGKSHRQSLVNGSKSIKVLAVQIPHAHRQQWRAMELSHFGLDPCSPAT